MAEIIFDGAPAITQMYFTTGTDRRGGQGQQHRQPGRPGGARSSPTTSSTSTEPFFQDGVVAQAVDAREGRGVTYLASAGNRARQSWEGTYAATTDPGRQPRATTSTPAALPTPSRPSARSPNRAARSSALQWAEPWGAGDDGPRDRRLRLDGVLDSRHRRHRQHRRPGCRRVRQRSTVTGSAHDRDRDPPQSRDRQPVHEVHRRRRARRSPIAEYATNSQRHRPGRSLGRGRADDRGVATGPLRRRPSRSARAVPRSPGASTPAGEPLRTRRRAKPDLAAADGVATSVRRLPAVLRDERGDAERGGDRCAGPRRETASLTVDQVAAILTEPGQRRSTARRRRGSPTWTAGPASSWPTGRCRRSGQRSPPVDRRPLTSPGSPNGKDGWYTGDGQRDLDRHRDRVDPGEPEPAAEPTAVTTDGVFQTLTCSATSIGGHRRRQP